MSRASNSGSSAGAKCPPRGIGVHRRTLHRRSTQSRMERSFAWASRFRRLARDYGRLPSMLAGLHFAAFACLMLHQFIHNLSP
jgi:hypothetical protein